jgi:hypothetical protein
MQTLEYREDVFPEQPRAGPSSRTWGLPLGSPDRIPRASARLGRSRLGGRAVTLPEGWAAIEIERIWIGGRPYNLVARQGAERVQMTPLCQHNREG